MSGKSNELGRLLVHSVPWSILSGATGVVWGFWPWLAFTVLCIGTSYYVVPEAWK